MAATAEEVIVLHDVHKTYHLGEVDVVPARRLASIARQLVAIQGCRAAARPRC
jgi:hypothetical protein